MGSLAPAGLLPQGQRCCPAPVTPPSLWIHAVPPGPRGQAGPVSGLTSLLKDKRTLIGGILYQPPQVNNILSYLVNISVIHCVPPPPYQPHELQGTARPRLVSQWYSSFYYFFTLLIESYIIYIQLSAQVLSVHLSDFLLPIHLCKDHPDQNLEHFLKPPLTPWQITTILSFITLD